MQRLDVSLTKAAATPVKCIIFWISISIPNVIAFLLNNVTQGYSKTSRCKKHFQQRHTMTFSTDVDDAKSKSIRVTFLRTTLLAYLACHVYYGKKLPQGTRCFSLSRKEDNVCRSCACMAGR